MRSSCETVARKFDLRRDNSWRRSSASESGRTCEASGFRSTDPHVGADRSPVHGLEHVELTPAEVRSADIVIVLVDHDAFDLEMVGREASFVLDTRRCLHGPNVEHL